MYARKWVNECEWMAEGRSFVAEFVAYICARTNRYSGFKLILRFPLNIID